MTTGLRIEIFPADLAATADFYRSVLGFTPAEERPDYLALRRDAVRVGAARRDPQPDGPRRPPTGVELVLEVDDLDAERDRVRSTGWPVVEDLQDRPWGLRDFRLVDPDGYYWRLTNR